MAFQGVGSFDILLERSLILAYVSIMSNVVRTALGLFIIVASIYRSFSVKAVGSFTLPPFIETEALRA